MNKKLILAVMFLLLLLSGCVSLGGQNKEAQKSVMEKFSKWYLKWSRPIHLAIAILIAILAIAWMYGQIFQKEDVKVWVKAEIANLIYTIMILFFIFILLESASFVVNVLPTYTPIPKTEIGKEWIKFVQFSCQNQLEEKYRPCHIKIAQDYLELLSKSSLDQITNIIRMYNIISISMSLGLSLKNIIAPGGIFSISPFIGLVPIGELLQFSYDVLLKNYVVIKAQQIALDLMHVAFFPYLLSFGLFLRVFHFTRKLGGLMLALAVAFYIVWPLLYVFWASIYYSFTGPWELDLTKTQTFVSTLYFQYPELSIYSPNKNSPDYSGMCANGIIDSGEECNEYESSTLKELKPKILSCPPKDSEGKVIAGREKDIYCNYNNCKCVSKPIDLKLNVRKDIIEEEGEEAKISESARRYIDICYEKAKTTPKEISDGMDLLSQTILEPIKSVDVVGAVINAMFAGGLFGENGLLHNVSKVFIFSIVAPFISFMATLATLKVLSPLLGGDAYLAGLSRLI